MLFPTITSRRNLLQSSAMTIGWYQGGESARDTEHTRTEGGLDAPRFLRAATVVRDWGRVCDRDDLQPTHLQPDAVAKAGDVQMRNETESSVRGGERGRES